MASPSSYGPRVDLMALQLYHGRRVYPTPITARVLGRPRRQGGLSYAVILAGKEISKACLLSKPGVPTPGTPSNRSRTTATVSPKLKSLGKNLLGRAGVMRWYPENEKQGGSDNF